MVYQPQTLIALEDIYGSHLYSRLYLDEWKRPLSFKDKVVRGLAGAAMLGGAFLGGQAAAPKATGPSGPPSSPTAVSSVTPSQRDVAPVTTKTTTAPKADVAPVSTARAPAPAPEKAEAPKADGPYAHITPNTKIKDPHQRTWDHVEQVVPGRFHKQGRSSGGITTGTVKLLPKHTSGFREFMATHYPNSHVRVVRSSSDKAKNPYQHQFPGTDTIHYRVSHGQAEGRVVAKTALVMEFGPYGPSLRGTTGFQTPLSISGNSTFPYHLKPCIEKERAEAAQRRLERLKALALDWTLKCPSKKGLRSRPDDIARTPGSP